MFETATAPFMTRSSVSMLPVALYVKCRVLVPSVMLATRFVLAVMVEVCVVAP